MIDDTIFDDLDRSFLSASSCMADFFSWTYGMLGGRLVAPLDPEKFDNATSKTKEIGVRVLIVLGTAVSLVFAGTYIGLAGLILGVGSKVFRGIGFALQKEGFTHVRGNAPEKSLENGRANVMTWNLRGHGGGLHYAEGGVIHWRSRIDSILESLKSEDPDIIVLQEIYDTAFAEALMVRLKDSYAHFYTHLGKNMWGNTSGCMVITKCAVHRFSHTDFTNNSWKTNRGFSSLEVKANPTDGSPCLRIIGTQLDPERNAQEKRIDQIYQMVHGLAKEKMAVPTLFVGSGADRDSKEEGELLSKYLYHSYREDLPTHSGKLAEQWAPIYQGYEKASDFISFFKRNPVGETTLPVIEKGIRLAECHLVEAFEDYNTKTARSDHHAVVATLDGLRAVPVPS